MRWINKELKNVEGFYDNYDDEDIYEKYDLFKEEELKDTINFNLGEIESRLSSKDRYRIIDELGLSNSDIEFGDGAELLSGTVNNEEIKYIAKEMDILYDYSPIIDKGFKTLKNGFKVYHVEDFTMSESKIVQCPICNTAKYHYNSIYECDECGFKGIGRGFKESKGEVLIKDILTENGFKFDREVKVVNNYRFDFVVYHNDVKYYLEVNGIQHYKPIEYFGGIETYNKQLLRDVIKKSYANKNGVYVELDYREHNLKLLKDRFESEFINKYIKETIEC